MLHFTRTGLFGVWVAEVVLISLSAGQGWGVCDRDMKPPLLPSSGCLSNLLCCIWYYDLSSVPLNTLRWYFHI